MDITEYTLERLEEIIEGLRSDIRELQYKVQQLEYYKADDRHTHPEYERR